jgi:transposase-like protein
MYSQGEIDAALKFYHQCKSVTKTIQVLCYPTRETLYTWIKNEGTIPPRKTLTNVNTTEHPRNPPFEVKMDAIHRCFELGESIKSVSEAIGYTRASIYTWRKKYLQGGAAALMNSKNIKPDTLTEGKTESTPELEQLQAQMRDMQLEIDILKETINVLKKDPGIDQTVLKNNEKAVIVDALKTRYSLPILLKRLDLSKSSYYYQEAVKRKPDKYSNIRKRISELFHENKKRYGYRRIYGLLKREDITVSEKVVRRIMSEEKLVVKTRKRKKYNSYRTAPPLSSHPILLELLK